MTENCWDTFSDAVCCVSKTKFPTPYDFSFNGHDKTAQNQKHFETNFVKTSKYTWYSFLPKALLLQFKRLANIYFLLISILQSIPAISPLGPATAWAPLGVVLGISMIRQGYEDYQKYKDDKKTNNDIAHAKRNGELADITWSQILVGDIVKVYVGEFFPADLVLISSSDEGGKAFIETASLDGETNLKPRNAFQDTQVFNNEQSVDSIKGQWKGKKPQKDLHQFSAQMMINGKKIVFIDEQQLLYRGAKLKNTKWIYGLVFATGANTKIILNSGTAPQKMSQVQHKVNLILVFIFAVQLILSIMVGIINGIFRNIYHSDYYYIGWSSYSSVVDGILACLSYLVLINTMIPISLIVSIQIVKMFQGYFLHHDNLMHSQIRNTNVVVHSSSLNQELGQIQYVFTDKTGTLTCNKMEFKIAVIGDYMFGDKGLVTQGIPVQTTKGFNDDSLLALVQGTGNIQTNPKITISNGPQSINYSSMKELADQYLIALAVAHEVIIETDKDGKPFYQGPSPDEIGLVDAAKKMNYQFIHSTKNTIEVKVNGQVRKLQKLQTFPFTSDRKRMSCVVKDGKFIKMYVKGADSIIKARLSSAQTLNLDDYLNRFSSIGLRTLLIGMRIISEQQYKKFVHDVQNLPLQNKKQHYDKLVSNLEQGFYLLGATGVLDRLQDDVPITIRDLIRANIKVWMLTGDKMETAENIAKSCNLIQKEFQILKFDCKEENRIAGYLQDLGKKAEDLTDRGIPKAFMIQGEDLTKLTLIIGRQACEIGIANMARFCEAVVCCRLAPIQKADIVRVVRERLNKITLAIGDGANDVPMIKTAHIGVGLFGQQGNGAVQASDYALGQFRMLWRLLFVHGRWNYIRISEMILYFFYKNMLFTIPQFLYAFYCGYSGQTIFDDIYISMFNLIFTALPLVVRAVLEQDVNYVVQDHQKAARQSSYRSDTHNNFVRQDAQLVSKEDKYIPSHYHMNKYLYKLFPKIYFIGQQNCIFNYMNFFMWMAESLVESFLIFFFCIYILGAVSISNSGYNGDLWLMGLTVYSSVIVIVTFKLATHTRFWTMILFFVIIVLSLGLYIAYMWIANTGFNNWALYVTSMAFTTGQCYFIVLFMICCVLFVDGVVLTVNFNRGGTASKMRIVIEKEKQDNKSYYDALSLRATDFGTVNNDRKQEQNQNQGYVINLKKK